MLRDPLAGLNEQQREVVVTTDGPVLVLAGAGSGKTRALTHRIAYLLDQKLAAPEQIMAVTFTNKAAQEMRQRVKNLTGADFETPKALGTFHGLGARLLRQWYAKTNRTAAFTILDESDVERLVKKAIEQASLNPKEWSPRTLRHAISRVKNEQKSPDQVATEAGSRAEEVLGQVYQNYQKLLAKHDSYDFDDLLLETVRLLNDHEDVRKYYQELWQYLCVDEYQDTNPVQDYLLKLLLNEKQNICVVGDDYQAIYSWRGAKVDHILNFERSFPNCRSIYLTQNYRSTPAILSASNRVISENVAQKHKELWTDRSGGEQVQVVAFPSDLDEARTVCQIIQDKIRQGAKASDYAILYRTNAQSRLFEEQFLRRGMPYFIVGGIRFYERAEVKDALAFLQLFVNPRAELAFRRLVGILAYGVGPKTIDRIVAIADANNASLTATILGNPELTARQQSAMQPIMRALMAAKNETVTTTVAKTLDTLLSASGYLDYLQQQPDGQDRVENINELLSVASQYSDPVGFVEAVALMSDADQLDQTDQTQQGRVLCMTLHAAKGLEFPNVFLVGCEENLLPHSNSFDSQASIEEERRLLYVGMTRAKEALTLSYAATRNMRGETTAQLPSRFLSALPSATKSQQAPAAPSFFQPKLETNEPVYCAYEIGDFLNHPLFGKGVVIETQGSTVTCIFEGHGIKTIDSTAINV